MNKYIVSALIITILVSVNPVHAAINEKNWSFDNIYSNIKDLSFNTIKQANPIQDTVVVSVSAPVIKTKTAFIGKRIYFVSATAYSSTPDQTDDSPFITAAGTYVRDGIVAANFLPLGTMIKIPEIYGDKIFIVEDRMNRRYPDRVDVWFPKRVMADDFGIKYKIKIEVI